MLNQFPYLNIQTGTFSGLTFQVRYPRILQQIVDSRLFDHEVNTELLRVKNELSALKIIRLDTTPKGSHWNDFYNRYEDLGLLDIPFFYAEVYFFALIRKTVDYINLKIDPFLKIKRQDLISNITLLNTVSIQSSEWSTKDFILFSLHGNKSDLSQLKYGGEIAIELLIDDTVTLIKQLDGATNCHIIQDNCGIELFSDLMMANHLVETYNHTVYIHLKSEPIFVSDSLTSDLDFLLDNIPDPALCSKFKEKIKQGRIVIKTNFYWSSPSHFDKISDSLNISGKSIILSKGDANYRRFFCDKNIDPSLKSERLTQYLKTPTFCIRTLKSEIQTGISKETLERLNNVKSDWMSDGSYAVIQYINRKIPV